MTWTRQGGPDEVILAESGPHPEDRGIGNHGDVVVDGDRAVLSYFTAPWPDGGAPDPAHPFPDRLTAVHAAELRVVDGRLVCVRGGVVAPLSRNAA